MDRRGALVAVALLVSGCLAAPSAPPPSLEALPCGDPCVVDLGGGTASAYEPSVAVAPTDPLHIVATAMQPLPFAPSSDGSVNRWGFVHVSRDGGATWASAPLPGGPTAPPDHPLARATAMADLSVVILLDGTVLVAGFTGTGGRVPGQTTPRLGVDEGVFVARSGDGGATFEVRRLSGAGTRFYFFTPDGTLAAAAQGQIETPRLSVGEDGVVRLAWAALEGTTSQGTSVGRLSRLLLARSTDGGVSWSEPQQIVAAEGLLAPTVVADAAGEEWVSYHNQATDTLHVAKRDGSGWRSAEVGSAARWRPDLALHEGRLVAAFAVPEDGRESPAASFSDDGGRTWSAPRVLDAPTAAGSALVALAVDRTGRAYVTYYAPHEDGSAFRAVALEATGPLASASPLELEPYALAEGRAGEYTGLATAAEGAFAVWVHGGADGTSLAGAWLRSR